MPVNRCQFLDPSDEKCCLAVSMKKTYAMSKGSRAHVPPRPFHPRYELRLKSSRPALKQHSNIARGTTDPEIDSVTGIELGNNMAPITLVANWPLDGATYISCKFGHTMAPLA